MSPTRQSWLYSPSGPTKEIHSFSPKLVNQLPPQLKEPGAYFTGTGEPVEGFTGRFDGTWSDGGSPVEVG
jgi:hypothetical protein